MRLRCGRIISKFMVESWENVVLLWVVQWHHEPPDLGFGPLRWCVWLSERTGGCETRTDIFLGRGHKESLKKKADFFSGVEGVEEHFLFLLEIGSFFCVCFFRFVPWESSSFFHHQRLGELTFQDVLLPAVMERSDGTVQVGTYNSPVIQGSATPALLGLKSRTSVVVCFTCVPLERCN